MTESIFVNMLTLKFRVTRVARPRNTLFGNIAREWSDKSKFVKVVKPAKSPACNASILPYSSFWGLSLKFGRSLSLGR